MSLVARAGYGALYEVRSTIPQGSKITVSYAGVPGIAAVAAFLQTMDNFDFSGSLSGTPWNDNPFVGDASASFAGPILAGVTKTIPEAGAMQNAGTRGACFTLSNSSGVAWLAPLGSSSPSNGFLVSGGNGLFWRFGTQPGSTTGIPGNLNADSALGAQGAVVAVATIGTVTAPVNLGQNAVSGDTVDVPVTADVYAFAGRAILVVSYFLYDPAVLTPSASTDWPTITDDTSGSNRAKGRFLSPVELPISDVGLMTFRNYFAVA